ncbi:molybdate ABC transporter substrate-binding protein [Oceanobacillus bengalensis]|uniref:Molybdate ABC transporter substrate-binding protein n=1 Tax=Oceanobacillus bengalensis TaxID=1435466 RepID=A0A494Z504_9BACI|nr:molybdate ABC transporter substrate-binding protein [Oceanobacillus bengalensis]RKQ17564.1 molybdate ABC transporter substrate-binding protein [Oceanobacillus bengalensis]
MRILYIILMMIPVFIAGCSEASNASDDSTEILISSASSLTESLLEIKDEFEKHNESVTVTFNFGGSGSLRKQIEQGAPADLFFSASKKDYELLVEEGMVLEGSAILENELVLIKSKQTDIDSLDDFLLRDGELAVGTPEAVPAGTYAKEVLENLGVWNQLQDRMVLTKDVTQVLTYVREGAADIGFVYASDIVGVEDIDSLEKIDTSLHAPIEYYAAIINKETEGRPDAIEDFYQFLHSDLAIEIFEKNGFQVSR